MWNRESQKSSNVMAPTLTPPPVTMPVEPRPVAPQPEPAPVSLATPPAPAKAKGSTLVIKGELIGSEDLVVEGQIEGKISLPDHVLTIGLGSEVTAEIVARVVIVHGNITGNVSASERVELRSTGRMLGDLISPRVMMNDGATFKGHLETRLPGKADNKSKPKTPELVAV